MADATLRLRRSLYTRAALNATTEAYGELATITVRTDGDYYSVDFASIDPDVESVLTREFANFALAETIEGRT